MWDTCGIAMHSVPTVYCMDMLLVYSIALYCIWNTCTWYTLYTPLYHCKVKCIRKCMRKSKNHVLICCFLPKSPKERDWHVKSFFLDIIKYAWHCYSNSCTDMIARSMSKIVYTLQSTNIPTNKQYNIETSILYM